MATSQTARIAITATATGIGLDGQSTTRFLNKTRSLSNGTTVGKADKCYYAKHTIADNGTPQNLDFVGGTLRDINGDLISWAEMTTLVVFAPSTNAATILVGGHANPIDFGCGANTIDVKADEEKVLINTGADGAYPLVGGSSDALKLAFTPSVADQVLYVFAVGRSS